MEKSQIDSSRFVRLLGYIILLSSVVLYIFSDDRLKLYIGSIQYIFEKDFLATIFSGTGIFLTVIGTCGAVPKSYEAMLGLYSVLIVILSLMGRISTAAFLSVSLIFAVSQMIFIYRYTHGKSGEVL